MKLLLLIPFLISLLAQGSVLAQGLHAPDTVFRTRAVRHGRIDVEEGILRSAYEIEARVRDGLQPENAAREHIALTPAYGIDLRHLEMREVRGGRYATHVTFQQTFAGLPVYNREVKVNLDAQRQPTLVLNGYAPHLEGDEPFASEPHVTPEAALDRVAAILELQPETTSPLLMVYPSNPPRLVWKVTAWNPYARGEWDVLIDAASGEAAVIVETVDRESRVEDRGSNVPPSHVPPSYASPSHASPSHVPTSHVPTFATGYVFDPDPLSSAGVEYGGAYVDANDADVPELNAQRFEVVLRDISQGADGLFRLDGPYVRMDGSNCGIAYTPPAEASPDAFRYTRAHPWFEAVSAYYHIDKSQRYIQSLDVGFPIREEPVRVNPRGVSSDDSFWSGGCIRFGVGGIDDAEDADVILHEYGHALLDDVVPGLRSSDDGKGYHEGWSDYWAASYSRFLSEEDSQIPEHNWRKVFSWDGNTECWKGRTLDHPGHYPDETVIYPTEGCQAHRVFYQEGMLWATTMMEIFDVVGREVMDRLHLASFGYLSSTARWPDFAAALLQADRDLYGGVHKKTIAETLIQRGYLPEGTAVERPASGEDVAALLQNFPNPFSGSTEIHFVLSSAAYVQVDVFDMTGRRVRALTNAHRPPGKHAVAWDGCDEDGRAMASGVYIYRMRLDDATYSRTMLLVR